MANDLLEHSENGLFLRRCTSHMFAKIIIVLLVAIVLASPTTVASPIVDPVSTFTVRFAEGQYSLRLGQADELREIADFLTRFSQVRVWVDGHADATEGSDAVCQRISDHRAKVVYEWLQEKGFGTQLQGHRGFGRSHPIDLDDTEEHQRSNRRVEVHVADQP